MVPRERQNKETAVRADVGGGGGYRVGVVVLVLASGMASLVPAWAGPRTAVAKLAVGDTAFWTGKAPEAAEAPLVDVPRLLGDEQPRPCEDDGCVEYAVDVVESGARLRVGIDTPDCDSSVSLEVLDPHGSKRASTETCYSAEMFVRDAAKGRWTVRVWTTGEATPYRMRAKLEPAPKIQGPRRKLLPNLRVEPPSGLTFSTNGIAGLTPRASGSCYEEEVVEDSARRCLRFTVGPENAGAGPLELKFDRLEGTDASMRQRVYYSDGTSEMRDAGKSEFHKTHQHFHLNGFARFGLYRVTDREHGSMRTAGGGNKAGFCLVDYKIARWRHFNQERAYSARSNCMPVGGEAELGLSAGWTDIYGYDLPGNYVEFGDNGDGYYVLGVTVDSLGYILETNERDNRGYTYFQIKDGMATVLERGRGKSPWDPKKVVLKEWWRH